MKVLKSHLTLKRLFRWLNKIPLSQETKPMLPTESLSPRTWLSLDFGEAIKIPGLGRIDISPQNTVTVKYRAADPSDVHTALINSAINSRGNYQSQLIIAVKDHAIKLYQIIRDLENHCEFRNATESDYTWESVRNHLHMAASINDVYADTSSIDDSGSIGFCRPAWEFEEAHSEVVSKFIAAQIFFNFIWMAYECAIEIAGDGKSIKKKTGAKGRVILSESHLADNQIPYFKQTYLMGLRSCYDNTQLRNSKDIRNLLNSLHESSISQSAELVRIVRNRVMHGDETAGDPEDYGGLSEKSFANPTQRLYYASRITLLLIQSLALMCVKDCTSIMNSPYEEDFDEFDNLPTTKTIGFTLRNIHVFQDKNSANQLEFDLSY